MNGSASPNAPYTPPMLLPCVRYRRSAAVTFPSHITESHDEPHQYREPEGTPGRSRSHLKSAATAAGGAIKGATGAAGDELRIGKANVKAELSDTALSGLAAAEFGGAAAKEQVDALMDKGKDLVDSAAELIRERPLASFGVAFAAGWIIAKLARSGGDK